MTCSDFHTCWKCKHEYLPGLCGDCLEDAIDERRDPLPTDEQVAAHVAKFPDAFAAWMPEGNAPSFLGLDRSAPSSFFSRPLPKVRRWTRARWALGRWLSRGAP